MDKSLRAGSDDELADRKWSKKPCWAARRDEKGEYVSQKEDTREGHVCGYAYERYSVCFNLYAYQCLKKMHVFVCKNG